jgi:hypothetical protein
MIDLSSSRLASAAGAHRSGSPATDRAGETLRPGDRPRRDG